MRRTTLLLLALLVILPAVVSHAQSGVRAVVVNESANVRVAPAIGAEVIANVPAGYTFEAVTGRSGDHEWLRVDFNGEEGWVHVAPLTILAGDVGALPVGDPRSIPYGGFESPRAGATDATSPISVRVTNGLRVRAGPGRAYPTLANMFAGTVVPALGRTLSNGWVQVNYEGTLGWVASGFLEFTGGSIIELPVDGVVASAAPIVGRTSDDYFDTLRLMLARLDLAQPSLDNLRAKWTDAALNGRAFCRDYPARPSDMSIAVPTLAAYNNILDPLITDFNAAMFNVRHVLDLFIEVCNQPGLGNPVGEATVIGALDIVNLADSQFTNLRARLRELIPPDREIQPDECLFTWRTRQEILKIMSVGQIVRQQFTPKNRTIGFCIDIIGGATLAFQSLVVKGENPHLLVAITPMDNPTSFVASTLTDPGHPTSFIAPITITNSGRYLVILSATAEASTVNSEIAFVFSAVNNTGIYGQLVYDEHSDVVYLSLPNITSPDPGLVPTPGGNTMSLGTGGNSMTCPSLAFTCSQLMTCQEAVSCLAMGNTTLDPDGDGLPCPNLCSP